MVKRPAVPVLMTIRILDKPLIVEMTVQRATYYCLEFNAPTKSLDTRACPRVGGFNVIRVL